MFSGPAEKRVRVEDLDPRYYRAVRVTDACVVIADSTGGEPNAKFARQNDHARPAVGHDQLDIHLIPTAWPKSRPSHVDAGSWD